MTHNSHPLRSNLVHRGMKIEERCATCNSVGEDAGHLFFKCTVAKQVWGLLNLEMERSELAKLHCPRDAADFILKGKENRCLLIKGF